MKKLRDLTLELFLDIKNKFPDGNLLQDFDGTNAERLKRQNIQIGSYDELTPYYRQTLEFLLEGTPKEFQDHVCVDMHDRASSKSVYDLTDIEVRVASNIYKDYFALNQMFDAIFSRLEIYRQGKGKIDGNGFAPGTAGVVPISFVVRQTKRKNGQLETKLQLEWVLGDLFLNINLTQLRRCERGSCRKYFYATKDDERIKYCSTKCSNAVRQSDFQERHNGK